MTDGQEKHKCFVCGKEYELDGTAYRDEGYCSTVFWLARNVCDGVIKKYTNEPLLHLRGRAWQGRSIYDMGIFIDPENKKIFLPGISIRKGKKLKILRTVTPDGKVIFERA